MKRNIHMQNKTLLPALLLLAICLLFSSCNIISDIGTKRRLEEFERTMSERTPTESGGSEHEDKAEEAERSEAETSEALSTQPAETTEQTAPERQSTEPAPTEPNPEKNPAKSTEAGTETAEGTPEEISESTYICNSNTKRFHDPSCSSASEIKEKNRWEFTGSREELISAGYLPCKRCNP